MATARQIESLLEHYHWAIQEINPGPARIRWATEPGTHRQISLVTQGNRIISTYVKEYDESGMFVGNRKCTAQAILDYLNGAEDDE